MLGNQQLAIYRETEDETRDAEGRRAVTGVPELVATVSGHLFSKDATVYTTEGQILTVWLYRAFVPTGTDVRPEDRIVGADGRDYRVQTVTERRGPDGRVHHLSLECAREG